MGVLCMLGRSTLVKMHYFPMLKFSARLFTPLAVGALLSQVPQGEISCATVEAYWTNDADYQNKVA